MLLFGFVLRLLLKIICTRLVNHALSNLMYSLKPLFIGVLRVYICKPIPNGGIYGHRRGNQGGRYPQTFQAVHTTGIGLYQIM